MLMKENETYLFVSCGQPIPVSRKDTGWFLLMAVWLPLEGAKVPRKIELSIIAVKIWNKTHRAVIFGLTRIGLELSCRFLMASACESIVFAWTSSIFTVSEAKSASEVKLELNEIFGKETGVMLLEGRTIAGLDSELEESIEVGGSSGGMGLGQGFITRLELHQLISKRITNWSRLTEGFWPGKQLKLVSGWCAYNTTNLYNRYLFAFAFIGAG
jgi:hypothetical protein